MSRPFFHEHVMSTGHFEFRTFLGTYILLHTCTYMYSSINGRHFICTALNSIMICYEIEVRCSNVWHLFQNTHCHSNTFICSSTDHQVRRCAVHMGNDICVPCPTGRIMPDVTNSTNPFPCFDRMCPAGLYFVIIYHWAQYKYGYGVKRRYNIAWCA